MRRSRDAADDLANPPTNPSTRPQTGMQTLLQTPTQTPPQTYKPLVQQTPHTPHSRFCRPTGPGTVIRRAALTLRRAKRPDQKSSSPTAEHDVEHHRGQPLEETENSSIAVHARLPPIPRGTARRREAAARSTDERYGETQPTVRQTAGRCDVFQHSGTCRPIALDLGSLWEAATAIRPAVGYQQTSNNAATGHPRSMPSQRPCRLAGFVGRRGRCTDCHAHQQPAARLYTPGRGTLLVRDIQLTRTRPRDEGNPPECRRFCPALIRPGPARIPITAGQNRPGRYAGGADKSSSS